MAINMDEFAQTWFQGPSAPAAAPAPPPVQQAPAPAPVQQAQPQQQLVQQQAQWRRCPDGSLISSDYALDWGGEIGDPQARVRLRHATGPIVFDGAYGELLAQQIPGVWVPGATVIDDETGQPIGATAYGDGFSGMGATAPAKDWKQTAKKVVGGALVAASVGGALWAGWGLISGSSSKKKPRDEED